MKRFGEKLIVAAFVVFLAPVIGAACPFCRAQAAKGIYNADFYTNLFFALLPIALLTAFGIVLYRADDFFKNRREKMK